MHIVRNQVWGAPDIAVDVLSPSTARRDRTVKLGWYRQYGVGECWLVDAHQRVIEVVDSRAPDEAAPARCAGLHPLRSRVLPAFVPLVDHLFG
jgi:hypothetical protein